MHLFFIFGCRYKKKINKTYCRLYVVLYEEHPGLQVYDDEQQQQAATAATTAE